ncbi:MAG: hypothetical protein M3Q08_12405, partial [Pseudomonadota bacterium]|nr:hypothetical protein [Pseudomonadota bacterium]
SPSGRPSGAPQPGPSLPPIPASMTPDIIDLHGSNQVSGRNRALSTSRERQQRKLPRSLLLPLRR